MKNLKALYWNRSVTPQVAFGVYHIGKNRYVVEAQGIGTHSLHAHLGLACQAGHRLIRLEQEDLNYEIARIQERNA
jgi:hypothetical protein